MKFYTYKKQVPLKPGERLGYQRGKGYYVIPAQKLAPVRQTSRARFVLFAAQEPLKALHAPAKYAVALSADLAYRDESVAAIQPLRAAGYRVCGWCDCRPSPGGTPAHVGQAFVRDHDLDYFIGQAESAAEYDDAMTVQAPVVVGNITALRQDQIDLLATQTLFIQEDYWCEGWGRAVHPNIVAYCAGTYPTALWPDPGPTIQVYKSAGRWREGDGLYHVAAVEDWQNLP